MSNLVELTPRSQLMPLHAMLVGLERDIEFEPPHPERCMKITMLGDPKIAKASNYARRFYGFRDFLRSFYRIDFLYVGAKKGCIGAYLMPEVYNNEVREYIFHNINRELFLQKMYQFDLHRLSAYGATLVLRYE